MIDARIEDLPWECLIEELRGLARGEARRWGAGRGDVDNAVQDACGKLLELGSCRLPPVLLEAQRGAWMRRVVRNSIFRILQAERRSRRIREPVVAASHAAARRWARHAGDDRDGVDVSGLRPEEARVLAWLRDGFSLSHICTIEGIEPDEVERRARWGGLRLKEPEVRSLPNVGRLPGSLAGLPARARRTWIATLDRHGWPDRLIARELGTTTNAVRLLRKRRTSRAP